MRTVTVRAAESVAPGLLAEIEGTFRDCYTLADLLAWAGRQSPRVRVAEIVTQDEYTHDVVLPFASSYLSFDTT
jgi:hypothetical protein